MKYPSNLIKVTLVCFSHCHRWCQLNAQEIKWDSTYRPGKYKEQVTKFMAEKKSKKDIVFLRATASLPELTGPNF